MLPLLMRLAVLGLLFLDVCSTMPTTPNTTDITIEATADVLNTTRSSIDIVDASPVVEADSAWLNATKITPTTATVPYSTMLTSLVLDEHGPDFSNASEEDISYGNPVLEVGNASEPSGRGWEWYPLVWSWWHVLQAIIAILGVIGNAVVIVVIYQRIAVVKSTEILIGALAIADFLTSVFLFPIPWAKRVPATFLGRVYCKLLYPSFFLWFAISASANILIAICIERYLAVVHPLYFSRAVHKRNVTFVVLGAWLLSFIQVVYSLFTFVHMREINYCATTITTTAGMQANAYYSFSVRLVIPILTMLITQILTARSLKRQAKPFKDMICKRGNDAPALSFHMVARNRIIKMMLIVVIVYVVTWTPNQIAYLCFNLGYIPQSYRGSPLHRVLGVIGSINSCVNPFIYASRSRAFREAVKGLILCTKTSIMSPFEFVAAPKQSMNLNTISNRATSSIGPPSSKI